MATQYPPRRPPKIRFRVLIIGRANAGKTSILQRVCDTTRSPTIYRRIGNEKKPIQLDPSIERGEHSIEDELIFSNHDGYIFHDSRGFEGGGDKELQIVQNFVQQMSGKPRLADRLHAIWYCIPMDNQRPGLDLKHFNYICTDRNVPVIGVFTKYDQFKYNIEMDLEDHPGGNAADEAETRFQVHYRRPLGEGARFVRVEKMHKHGRCDTLIEETAGALNDNVMTLMLLAVQRSNLELSVKVAVKRVYHDFGFDAMDTKDIVKRCLIPFPYLWLWDDLDDLLDHDLWHDDLDDLLDHDLWHDDDHDDLWHDDDLLLDHDLWHDLLDAVKHVMALSIIQQFCSGDSGYHVILAIIMIFKDATALRASGSSMKSALTRAESDYQKSNICSEIAQYFTAAPQEYSVQMVVDFIMGAHL